MFNITAVHDFQCILCIVLVLKFDYVIVFIKDDVKCQGVISIFPYRDLKLTCRHINQFHICFNFKSISVLYLF